MQQGDHFSHERGDYTTAGIAFGAVLGAVGGMALGDAAIGVGAAIGAAGGLMLGALLDAWADHPRRGGHRGQPGAT